MGDFNLTRSPRDKSNGNLTGRKQPNSMNSYAYPRSSR
jgi:hypothetical protein